MSVLDLPKLGVSYFYHVKNIIALRGLKFIKQSFEPMSKLSDDVMVIEYESNDGIKDIAENYGFRYFRIEKTDGFLYHLSKMVNKAVIEAKYPFIARITQDVIYHKNTTNYILKFYKKHNWNKECLILQIKKGRSNYKSPMLIHNRKLLLKARGVDERLDIYDNEHWYFNDITLKVFKLNPTYIYEPLMLYHRPHKTSPLGIHPEAGKFKKGKLLCKSRIYDLSKNFKQEVKNVVNSYW